jgi:uncharacterized repeat protein (TIGR04138 family)
MPEPDRQITQLLRRDRRYSLQAYIFVFEALQFAQEVLSLGTVQASDPTEEAEGSPPAAKPPGKKESPTSKKESARAERHLTGQELCEAIRIYALKQFGYMAKCVLNVWGIKCTSDFGEIVYNLIEINQMRKTPEDRREDFDGVFDFEEGLQKSFRFSAPQ